MRRTSLLLALCLAGPSAQAGPHPSAPACPIFPANNVWHSDISTLPVHPRSAQWLASMDAATTDLHPDFGPSGLAQPYGIPYDIEDSSHPTVAVDFLYADESDPGSYPFGADSTVEMGSDRHVLMLDRDTCVLSELYDARWNGGAPTAGSGAVWDLSSNALRPRGWTSADAAGLPIFAGLIRRDEVEAGVIDHAIRLTADQTDHSYVWPARHRAGAAEDPSLPPMGARFRLRPGFSLSGFSQEARIVLVAMKRHGLILADNGSNWFFGGASENGWSNDVLDELKSVPATAFEAVDGTLLMVHPDSGEFRLRDVSSVAGALSRRRIRLGGSSVLAGRVTPAHPGQRVWLQRLRSGRWRNVRSRTLREDGRYAFRVSPGRAGRFAYRARFPGDADHLPASGRKRTLTVLSA